MTQKNLEPASQTTQPKLYNGPAAAAVLAAGIGCLALGLIVVLATAFPAIATALTFSAPVGPLSGKTTVAVVVWLIAWLLLHLSWRKRQVRFGWVYAITLLLIALGFLGTFPPIYDLFE